MISAVLRVLLVTCLLASLAPAQQSVKQADAPCESCHREIYRKYLATPMANASGLANDHFLPGDFTHASSGVHYAVARDHDRILLSYRDPKDPRIAGTRELQYFLGSGHLGTTYLYTQDGHLLESPVAWYASTGAYDMKPGFGQVTEMPSALPMEPACLRCHMSGVADASPGTRDRYDGLPFQQSGITCESCHGDTSAHVRSGGKAAVVNPAKLTPERRDAVCLYCHLEGNVALARANQDPLRYRPGDRLSDFLTFFVVASGDPLARGVSEVEQFASSRCKRSSGDSMSCSSCHDPHGSPSPAEKVAFYRGKCLACHGAPAFAATHHPENPDCASCHMPRTSAQNTPHVAWTDHRILRNPQQVPLQLTGAGSASPVQPKTLQPIFSPGANDRDAALAMYNAVMGGDLPDHAEALGKLEAAYAAGTHDNVLLEDLGALSGISGNGRESRAVFNELLRTDPKDLSALTNLGVLLARQGDYASAIRLWSSAFSRNGDDFTLGRNLSIVQCAAGNPDQAKQTLLRALSFSPATAQPGTTPAPQPQSPDPLPASCLRPAAPPLSTARAPHGICGKMPARTGQERPADHRSEKAHTPVLQGRNPPLQAKKACRRSCCCTR